MLLGKTVKALAKEAVVATNILAKQQVVVVLLLDESFMVDLVERSFVLLLVFV